jgi:formin-binding protein 1
VVFDFTATSPFELSIVEGAAVDVLEEDDGSGWVKVADDRGGKGLVPASYIELVERALPVADEQAELGMLLFLEFVVARLI